MEAAAIGAGGDGGGEVETKLKRAIGPRVLTVSVVGDILFTFVVAFAVMSSGIASASTLARAFAGDYLSELVDLPLVLAAIVFILVVAAINLRGIAESVGVNVVLTVIEVIGLVIIVVIARVTSRATSSSRTARACSP